MHLCCQIMRLTSKDTNATTIKLTHQKGMQPDKSNVSNLVKEPQQELSALTSHLACG